MHASAVLAAFACWADRRRCARRVRAAIGGAAAGLIGRHVDRQHVEARANRRCRQRLRELDDKARWLYEALNAQSLQRERSASQASVRSRSRYMTAHACNDAGTEAPGRPAPRGPCAGHRESGERAGGTARRTDAEKARARSCTARAQPHSAAAADRRDAPAWAALWSRLMGSNPLARIGVIVLFFGVASALRLAAQAGILPPGLRLAAAVAAGLVMIVASDGA
jgi:uncharacterized membrane protein